MCPPMRQVQYSGFSRFRLSHRLIALLIKTHEQVLLGGKTGNRGSGVDSRQFGKFFARVLLQSVTSRDACKNISRSDQICPRWVDA